MVIFWLPLLQGIKTQFLKARFSLYNQKNLSQEKAYNLKKF